MSPTYSPSTANRGQIAPYPRSASSSADLNDFNLVEQKLPKNFNLAIMMHDASEVLAVTTAQG